MRQLAALLLLALLAACGAGEPRGTADEVPIGIAPAPGVYPFQGSWAGPGGDCDAEPTVITTKSLASGAMRCDIASVKAAPEADGTDYAVTADCEMSEVAGEIGQVAGPTVLYLDLEGDTLSINGTAHRRCEPGLLDE